MTNPKPLQTEEFLAYQYKPQGEIPGNQPLAKRVTGVRLPVDVDEMVRSLPNSADWLRRVICQAAREEME